MMGLLQFFQPKQLQPPPKSTQPPARPMSESDADLYTTKKNEDGSDDFLTRQARLQAEARMALAQVSNNTSRTSCRNHIMEEILFWHAHKDRMGQLRISAWSLL
jgi:hypothetical protein